MYLTTNEYTYVTGIKRAEYLERQLVLMDQKLWCCLDADFFFLQVTYSTNSVEIKSPEMYSIDTDKLIIKLCEKVR